MNALRGLGLNITKAKLTDGIKASRFFVTDSKVSPPPGYKISGPLGLVYD
jgi:hypothetical protein